MTGEARVSIVWCRKGTFWLNAKSISACEPQRSCRHFWIGKGDRPVALTRKNGRPYEKENRPYIGKIPQSIVNINYQRSDWGVLEAGSRVGARDDNLRWPPRPDTFVLESRIQYDIAMSDGFVPSSKGGANDNDDR